MHFQTQAWSRCQRRGSLDGPFPGVRSFTAWSGCRADVRRITTVEYGNRCRLEIARLAKNSLHHMDIRVSIRWTFFVSVERPNGRWDATPLLIVAL